MSDFGVKRLSEGCNNLRIANFSGCKHLSDKGIVPLLTNCTKIRVLNLTRLNKITEKSLELVPNLPLLEEIYLYACSQLTDEALRHLAQLSRLRVLELCGCQLLSDESLVQVCRNNSDLHYLNLTWCLNVTDTAMLEGVATLRNLSLLSLFGNTIVT